MSATTRPTSATTVTASSRRARSENRGGRRGTGDAAGGADRVDERGPEAIELLAQVAHVGLHNVGVAVEVVAPHVIENLGLGQHEAGVLHEEAEEVELRGRQPQRLTR